MPATVIVTIVPRNLKARTSPTSRKIRMSSGNTTVIASKFPVFRLDKATVGEMDRKHDNFS
jgi:hypothetical protein